MTTDYTVQRSNSCEGPNPRKDLEKCHICNFNYICNTMKLKPLLRVMFLIPLILA